MLAGMKQLAICHDYNELLAAIRHRRDELRISHFTLDHVSGIPSGYASKLLASPPMKRLGALSLGPVLGALGLRLLVVDDPAALARVSARLVKKQRKHADRSMLTDQPCQRQRFLPFLDRAFARTARARGLSLQTPQRRQEIARKAAKARWARSTA
jgi:hypothetical protein